MNALSHVFLERSRYYLRGDYLPKITRCVDVLSEDDLWWRPNEASNSVGNLLLHLAGNARQWIVSGVGGADDVRERQNEFDARAPQPKADLLNHLRAALNEVDTVLANVDPDTLLDRRVIQGNDVTVLDAIYHAVEHFSTHTGQIIYITKMRSGSDLSFYEITADGLAKPRW